MIKGKYLPHPFTAMVAGFLALFMLICATGPAAAQSKEETKTTQKEKAEQKEEIKPVEAFLNTNSFFYYEGDPVEVEVMVGNKSASTVKNPVESSFSKWFILKDEKGEEVKATVSPDDSGEQHPSNLKAHFFYGIMLDLTKNFSQLKKPGKYTVQWKVGDVQSNELSISVIKRYDAEKEYYATLETDFGDIRLDFFKDDAPIAVKAFIDFANAGFYDGQIFYQTKPADYIMAGDPKGNGTGTSGLPFPAEYNKIPIVTGTVMMSPYLSAPARNDGKFLITLKPHPEKTGFMTVFAQVTDGLETVKKISTVPSTELAQEPYFKPLKDVVIKKVTIFEKAAKK